MKKGKEVGKGEKNTLGSRRRFNKITKWNKKWSSAKFRNVSKKILKKVSKDIKQ